MQFCLGNGHNQSYSHGIQACFDRVDRSAHAAGPSLEPHRALLRQWAQDKSIHAIMSRKAYGGFLLLAVEIAPQIIGISPS